MDDQVTQRLSILYAIHQMGKSVPYKMISSIFLEGLGIDPARWEAMMEDIRESDLVRLVEEAGEMRMIISDSGVVVLSFFQDRLPDDIQQSLQQLCEQSGPCTPDYQWETWYDQRSELLNLLLLEDHRKIFSLQMQLAEEDAEDILALDLPRDRSLLYELLHFLKKEEVN